jgi:hypothetical protein
MRIRINFQNQKARILFIAKEHNYLKNSDYETYGSSYQIWWNKHVKFRFSHRISEWAYGIMNNFPELDTIDDSKKHEALKSIAFINVKKVSGGANADTGVIWNYIDESRDLLHQQIAEIDPTIIICCFRYDGYIKHIFGNPVENTTSNKFEFLVWNNIPVLNFYHPSGRGNKYWLYDQIREAVNSMKDLLNTK